MKISRLFFCVLLFINLAVGGRHRILAQDSLNQPCGNDTQNGPSSDPCSQSADDQSDDDDDDDDDLDFLDSLDSDGNPTEPSDCEACQHNCTDNAGTDGDNPYLAYTGNAHREVRDLRVWGGVGQHQLNWTRFGNSRFTSNVQYFGNGANWRHSYQWEMTYDSTDNATKLPKFNLTYPDGDMNLFVPIQDPNNPGHPLYPEQWASTGDVTDTIYADPNSSNGYVLQTKNGWHFSFYLVSGSKYTAVYQMRKFSDTYGNVYTLAYDNANRVTKITEPAGRFLQVFYRDNSITQQTEAVTTLATIGATPAANQWTELDMPGSSASQPFRYFRYLSADTTYSMLADIQFFNYQGAQITGTPFGVASMTPDTSFTHALDGDPITYFESAEWSGGFVGLDLGYNSTTGKNNTDTLAKVRFYPRPGYEGKVVKGQIQGLNISPQYVSVIDHVTTSDGRTVQYTYQNFTDETLPYQYVVLSGAQYGDGTAAVYTHTQVFRGCLKSRGCVGFRSWQALGCSSENANLIPVI